MGSCTSVKSKNKDKNKIIISNTLKKNNIDDKLLSKNKTLLPNSLSIIINKYPEETNEEKVPISILQNTTFKEIFIQLIINIYSDYDLELKEKIIIYNLDINKKIIETIFEFIKNSLNEVIYLKIIYKGLQIPENIIESYIKYNYIIGSPIFDNPELFSIVIFYTQNKELKLYNIEESKDTQFSLINKFNSFTAYCNAKGILYISGGEYEQNDDIDKNNEFNDFFCIDLDKLIINNEINSTQENFYENENDRNRQNSNNYFDIIKLPNLLEPRTWHSMIFVPDKYIFIIGGNTKSVEIYNIEENKIYKDSYLIDLRNECTLCLVNNIFLYAFCGFYLHQTFNITVERCNLRKNERKWEYVKFKTNNNFEFVPSFFGISYYKNDNIVLIGGDSIENVNKSYILKIGNDDNHDEINEINLSDKKLGVFRDKLFYPIDNNCAVNIPLVYGEHIQLIFINMDNGDIQTQFFNDLFKKEE